MKDTIYIATVGTGTAGPDSFVANGILAGIANSQAKYVYLLPSNSQKSIEVADYVADETPICPYTADQPYFTFDSPDDLMQCRNDVAFIITALQARHTNLPISINPTSGTKPMTAAAFLAGIMHNVESFDYVCGERQDGVVKTGSEKVNTFPGIVFLQERLLEDALLLINHGSYGGAAALLMPHAAKLPKAAAFAKLLELRNNFFYAEAQKYATHAQLPHQKELLGQLACAPNISPLRAADMMVFVERHLDHHQPVEALGTLYRLAELLAKLQMQQAALNLDALTCEQIAHAFNPPKPVMDKLMSMERQDTRLYLGLRQTLQILTPTHTPIVQVLSFDTPTWQTIQKRNQTRFGHGSESIAENEVKKAFRNLKKAAFEQWPSLQSHVANCRFPDFNQCCSSLTATP